MTKVANMLFPADYFDKSSPDSALRAEYEAAMQEPRLDVILLDLEAFEERGELKLSRQPQNPALPLIYRGWMMKPARYLAFYEELLANGLKPLVGSREYTELHQFPLVYAKSEKLRALSPKAIVFPDGRINAPAVNAAFDRFVVKDYVKSAKNTSFPSSISTPISQDEADSLSDAFVELRAGLFTGGIVCKGYVDLAKYEGKTNEWRAFYFGGHLLNVCRNSNQLGSAPGPPEEMVCDMAGLGSPYYTVDFAEKADGEWMVVETGDGQVSGLAAAQDPVLYFAVLADAFEKEAKPDDIESVTSNENRTVGKDDYRNLLDTLKKERVSGRAFYGLVCVCLDACPDHLPNPEPAFNCECWVSEKGFFFGLRGENGTWSAGDPIVETQGEPFTLGRESALLISRLCHILRCPPMYVGAFDIREWWLFVCGMMESLPYAPFGEYAVEKIVHHAWSSFAAKQGEGDLCKLLARLAVEDNPQRGDYLRQWRAAFREALLFVYPEVGLSYAAYMGSANLFCFEKLLEEDWLW